MAVTTLYCDDEAIIGRASRDYALLVPEHASLASGSDGAFAPGSRWTLTSSVPFSAQGVAVGHAVILSQPGTRSSRFGDSTEVAVVDQVATGGITLRRPGLLAGQGEPYGAPAGTATVTFRVATVAQTIESVSYRLNKIFQIDDKLALRGTDDLYDVREIEELCVLWTLKRLCLDAWRNDRTKGDLWLDKAKCYEAEYDALLPSVVVHWGEKGDSLPPSSAFGTRISR